MRCCLLLCAGLLALVAPDLAPWPAAYSMGQHRALISLDNARISNNASAVWVQVPWQRRRIPDADTTNAVLTVVSTGIVVANVLRAPEPAFDGREVLNFIFEPVPTSGKDTNQFATDYALYYMPYTRSGRTTGLSLQATYAPIEVTANASWRAAAGISDAVLANGSYKSRFAEARCTVSKDARSVWDAFDPVMEIPASGSSVAKLLKEHPQEQVFFFAGERTEQMRMTDDLPQHWVNIGPSSALSGTSRLGEHFVLQAGIWSPQHSLVIKPSDMRWTDLMPIAGTTAVYDAKPIPASSITCYNTGGIDYRGTAFMQSYKLANATVGALWFGVDVPTDAAPGVYASTITVTVTANTSGKPAAPFPQTTVLTVNLTVVDGPPIEYAGADDAWRMARLSWLNSRLGIDRNTTSDGLKKMVSLLISTTGAVRKATMGGGRSMTIGPSNAGNRFEIVNRIGVGKVDVLNAPITFAAGDGIVWKASTAPVMLQSDNMTATTSSAAISSDGQLQLNSTVVISYDGFVDVTICLINSGTKPRTLQNTSMTVSVSASASKFFMGIGVEGRNRTAQYPNGVRWNWAGNKGGENQLWTGSTTAGLRLKFKGDEFDWESPLHMQSAAPGSWAGADGSGSVSAVPAASGGVIITAWSGAVTLQPSVPLNYKYDMLVTPVKTLDYGRHFRRDRYYQYGYNGHADCSQIGQMGVKVLNLHQGVDLNPYINYPFEHEAMEKQANFSRSCKALGVESVKIYYTTRELSNRCHEMPALMAIESPGDRIFDAGNGGGGSWLQEHLQSGYHVRWSSELAQGAIDEAIADTSLTRWVNFYVAGMQWLTQNHANTSAIDGVYLDELSFDRNTMQRMRKAVDRQRSGALFDLHSCNKFKCGVPSSPHACSALIYMAHFVFLDSLWFGEGFSPDYAPDQWLVEMSGIPFGMHAEQLTSPNLWRGMIFGEGGRPAADLWKAWDSLELTTDGTRLVGWWDDAPIVHITNFSDVIYASGYLRPFNSDGTSAGGVIAVASWDNKKDNTVGLAVDWAAFGLSATTATITASPIAGFQPALELDPSNLYLTVPTGKGWLLDVRRN